MSNLRRVVVPLNFIQDHPKYDHEKPYCLSQLALPNGEGDTNLLTESHLQSIENARLHPDWPRYFSVSTVGFTWLNHSTLHNVLDPKPDVIDAYIRESCTLLQSEFNASQVICYDFRIRINRPTTKEEDNSGDRSIHARPLQLVHSDVSMKGGPPRIRRHCTAEEWEEYSRPSFRKLIVNLWRPLQPIHDSPLAICDATSVDAKHLIAADLVTPTFAGEAYFVRPSKAQRWYWLPDQQPDEPCLWINWDSDAAERNVVRCCPHAAFEDPDAPKDAQPRSSVEIRAVVIVKGQTMHA